MKRRNIFVLYPLIIFILFIQSFSYSQDFGTLYNMYRGKDYFRLRDEIKNFMPKSNSWQKTYLEALSDCVFGKFGESKSKSSYLISKYSAVIPDSLFADLYLKKYYAHAFVYEYKDALETARILNSRYSNYLSQDEKDFLPEDIIMFTALKETPVQKITKNGETNIKMKKDIAGLWNMPLSINGSDFEFVFDSGAEYSVLVESLANKLGLKISDTYFKVGTSTDKKILSRVAVANNLKIGNAVLDNVVFYVMKDEDFTFGPYKIEGVVGAPIMRAFGEFRITNENDFIVPAVPGKSSIKNFAYHNYTPVIQMFYNNDSLSFIFDSGNMGFSLFKPFLEKYKSDITAKYTLGKILTGGAGGMIQTEGYIIDNLILKSGNLSGELKNVNLLANPLTEDQKYFHGNLGQDYIKQFKTLIMNYSDMYIEFQN
ncbi:MAG: pepsin/retropepsin-like aspartic protease family protein [Ignavibacteria bacterium]|nr:pepsin/retropepsin-like aspartic protease family protein [Ignavibacteria bacterium]